MTTIVAVESETETVFGADSRVSGYHLNDGWVSKIARNGDYVFAGAGHLRALQVMQFAKLPPIPEYSDPEDYDRFYTQEVVPALKTAFEDTDSTESGAGSSFLVAIRGRVYHSSPDGAWVRNPRGKYSVGSGSDYALGALEAGASVGMAIKIASRYDSGTNDDVKTVEVQK